MSTHTQTREPSIADLLMPPIRDIIKKAQAAIEAQVKEECERTGKTVEQLADAGYRITQHVRDSVYSMRFEPPADGPFADKPLFEIGARVVCTELSLNDPNRYRIVSAYDDKRGRYTLVDSKGRFCTSFTTNANIRPYIEPKQEPKYKIGDMVSYAPGTIYAQGLTRKVSNVRGDGAYDIARLDGQVTTYRVRESDLVPYAHKFAFGQWVTIRGGVNKYVVTGVNSAGNYLLSDEWGEPFLDDANESALTTTAAPEPYKVGDRVRARKGCTYAGRLGVVVGLAETEPYQYRVLFDGKEIALRYGRTELERATEPYPTFSFTASARLGDTVIIDEDTCRHSVDIDDIVNLAARKAEMAAGVTRFQNLPGCKVSVTITRPGCASDYIKSDPTASSVESAPSAAAIKDEAPALPAEPEPKFTRGQRVKLVGVLGTWYGEITKIPGGGGSGHSTYDVKWDNGATGRYSENAGLDQLEAAPPKVHISVD